MPPIKHLFPLVVATTGVFAQDADLQPTHPNVRYGEHPRQVMDVYEAKTGKPCPVMFFIHGGGWYLGGKQEVSEIQPARLLSAGISVVAINYRLIPDAEALKIKPPVKAPMDDAARALQFLRSKATEWNIDTNRICATGSSAGGVTSLWLALHDDMAKPNSADPIERESTRLWTVAVTNAQTTLDPLQMQKWIPNSKGGGHAFGIKSENKINGFGAFLKQRDKIIPWIEEYSVFNLVSADDPPVYLRYKSQPSLGKPQADPVHSANFGVMLKLQLKKFNVPCELHYPNAATAPHGNCTAYMLDKVTKDQQQAEATAANR
jgi:hypothetical protein